MKMIFDKNLCNESDAETTVVTYSNDFAFRRVDISATNNQCIMYTLTSFYKNVDGLKKVSVLWNVVNWSNKLEIRCNDNAFVFNIIFGYNTVF